MKRGIVSLMRRSSRLPSRSEMVVDADVLLIALTLSMQNALELVSTYFGMNIRRTLMIWSEAPMEGCRFASH